MLAERLARAARGHRRRDRAARRAASPTSTASSATSSASQLSPHNRWARRPRSCASVAGAHRRRALRPVLHRRRGAGDVAERAQRAAAAVEPRLDSHLLDHDGRARRRPPARGEAAHAMTSLPLAQPDARRGWCSTRDRPKSSQACLRHASRGRGQRKLMTDELVATLCEHAAGNPRALMTMADELLAAGRAARGQAARREALPRDLTPADDRPARASRPARIEPTGDDVLPSCRSHAPRLADAAGRAALAHRAAVGRRGGRHRRRRAEVLQVLPRARHGGGGRRGRAVPAALRRSRAPVACCSSPPRTPSMSCAQRLDGICRAAGRRRSPSSTSR